MTVDEGQTEGEESVPLHKRLITLFNAGARPLSSDALNALLQHFEGAEVSIDRVQAILAELTVGTLPSLETKLHLAIIRNCSSTMI